MGRNGKKFSKYNKVFYSCLWSWVFYSECACCQGDRDWKHVKLRTWGPEKILNSKFLLDSYRAGSLLDVEFSSCLKPGWMERWAPAKTYQSQHSRSGFLKHFVLSDKACGLLRFLRIVKETNYTEKLSKSSLRVGMGSGFSCPPPGDLPGPGIKPRSPTMQADSLLLSHQGSPCKVDSWWQFAVCFREPKTYALRQPRQVGWGGRWEGDWRGRAHVYAFG